MNRTLNFFIEQEYSGMTIGAFLKNHGISHPILVHLKKTDNSILLNNEWVYVNTKISSGDTLSIRIIENTPSLNIPPTYISRDDFLKLITYEDEDILVINKPSGLPVHPSMGHHEDTLANYCAYYYENYSTDEGAFVFRCINRLDRDTSGLVLIAKNMLSSAILSTSQLERGIHRTYMAICTGRVSDSGVIDLPIARKDDSVIERCIDFEKGEKAVTYYQTLETKTASDNNEYSLVKINLETGRTHQIRVHMKAIGHPLPGDFLYNPDFSQIKRQALHSYSLEFAHPISKQPLHFTQDIPDDFKFIQFSI